MIKQLRYVLATGMAAGFFGASGMANATTCTSAVGSYDSYISLLQFSNAELVKAAHPECFGGSSSNTAAAAQAIQSTTIEQMLVISSSVSARFAPVGAPPGRTADSGERKGLSAGSAGGKWNVWGSVAENDFKFDRGTYDLGGVFAGARTNKFDNRIQNVVIGADYQWAPDLALGLSGAIDNGRGSSASYTLAAPDASKSVSTNGYSIAPYLGWQINKDWALDATIGWGNGESTVDGNIKTDSRRFFYGTNVTYSNWYGNWQVSGKGGYLFGQEKAGDSVVAGVSKAGTKVTNEVGQFRLAGQAAYWMNGVMPYFGLAYVADNRSSSASAAQQDATAMGKSAFVWSLGANFISIKNAMTGGIGYEQETGRSRSKNNKLMANINVRF
jgi:hypothetical protein